MDIQISGKLLSLFIWCLFTRLAAFPWYSFSWLLGVKHHFLSSNWSIFMILLSPVQKLFSPHLSPSISINIFWEKLLLNFWVQHLCWIICVMIICLKNNCITYPLQVQYHEDFEKSRGKITTVADTIEMQHHQQNTKNFSLVHLHGLWLVLFAITNEVHPIFSAVTAFFFLKFWSSLKF